MENEKERKEKSIRKMNEREKENENSCVKDVQE